MLRVGRVRGPQWRRSYVAHADPPDRSDFLFTPSGGQAVFDRQALGGLRRRRRPVRVADEATQPGSAREHDAARPSAGFPVRTPRASARGDRAAECDEHADRGWSRSGRSTGTTRCSRRRDVRRRRRAPQLARRHLDVVAAPPRPGRAPGDSGPRRPRAGRSWSSRSRSRRAAVLTGARYAHSICYGGPGSGWRSRRHGRRRGHRQHPARPGGRCHARTRSPPARSSGARSSRAGASLRTRGASAGCSGPDAGAGCASDRDCPQTCRLRERRKVRRTKTARASEATC